MKVVQEGKKYMSKVQPTRCNVFLINLFL